jgi:hypothetical protein
MRLDESIILFEEVINLHWFLRTSVILFLADIAEFRTKIHEVHWKPTCLIAYI